MEFVDGVSLLMSMVIYLKADSKTAQKNVLHRHRHWQVEQVGKTKDVQLLSIYIRLSCHSGRGACQNLRKPLRGPKPVCRYDEPGHSATIETLNHKPHAWEQNWVLTIHAVVLACSLAEMKKL